MTPDLTNERGRAQAHAIGGVIQWAALQVEAALAADDRDRQSEASEVLGQTSTDIMTEGRVEEIEGLLDDMDRAFNDRDDIAYAGSDQMIRELLATMRREQLIMNDMLGLVQDILSQHGIDVGQRLTKLQEKHRETD